MSNDALTIASSPDAGRHYIAARAIKPGETILCARPDVWAPLWPCELSELTAREIGVMRADAGPSPPVGAPCDEEEEETRELIGSCSQYWLLAVRAALLSQDEPASFSSVLTLEDHGEARPPPLQQKLAALCSRLQRALLAGAAVRLEEALLRRLLGCILVNAFVRAPRLEPVPLLQMPGVGAEARWRRRGEARQPVVPPSPSPSPSPSLSLRARGGASSAPLPRAMRTAPESSSPPPSSTMTAAPHATPTSRSGTARLGQGPGLGPRPRQGQRQRLRVGASASWRAARWARGIS